MVIIKFLNKIEGLFSAITWKIVRGLCTLKFLKYFPYHEILINLILNMYIIIYFFKYKNKSYSISYIF